MSRYIFSKNNRWYISEVFDPSDQQLQEKATYYTLTDDVTGPYYAVGTSDSASIGVSYVPVVEPAGADVTLGVVDSQGHFQALRFNGTQASNSGSALEVQNYKTWNSTLPAPTPTGVDMDFYKCAYVNSNSWGGYKAVFNGSYYQFQSDSTGGLTYTEIVPQVGKTYASQALIEANLWDGIPARGLIFYAPLGSSISAITGQSLQKVQYGDTITCQTYKGILCAKLAYGSYINITSGLSSLPSGSSPFTISIWAAALEKPGSWGASPFGWGVHEDSKQFFIWYDGVNTETYAIGCNICSLGFASGSDYQVGNWNHIAFTYDGTIIRSYIDGVPGETKQLQLNLPQTYWTLGAMNNAEYIFEGYIAGARLFSRALSANQIATLAAEFTPTV